MCSDGIRSILKCHNNFKQIYSYNPRNNEVLILQCFIPGTTYITIYLYALLIHRIKQKNREFIGLKTFYWERNYTRVPMFICTMFIN